MIATPLALLAFVLALAPAGSARKPVALTAAPASVVLTGTAPFYKAMSISVPASLVALLRPGDTEGRGPYGLEVWRLSYRGR